MNSLLKISYVNDFLRRLPVNSYAYWVGNNLMRKQFDINWWSPQSNQSIFGEKLKWN